MKPSRMANPNDPEDAIFIPPSEILEEVEEYYDVDKYELEVE